MFLPKEFEREKEDTFVLILVSASTVSLKEVF